MVNLENEKILKSVDVDTETLEHFSENGQQEKDIAVIGIGLKVSNAETLEEYWEIFEHQIDCIRDMPQKRKTQVENYARIFPMTGSDIKFSKGTYLEHIDEFDYPFFKVTPREAELMEPAHRILLQTIHNTFVDAGYSKDSVAGTKTGVFIGYTAGSFKDNYLVNISFRYPELIKYALTGNMPALMPSRISQLFDLHGPTMILDTACSSSLLAVHQACESIYNGSSEMAIAGGIKINLLPVITEDLKLGIESIDNRTRTFDNAASGTGIGEGVFCILLKSLKCAELDGDHIYGVIKASAINHDGTASGLTAPNPSAQTEVIVSALEKARMQPEDISYVEVHGTATILGDPIEFQGLNHAYRKYTSRKQFCALSASKSNLGHLYECAGIAALVKALAALSYKKIPGTKHFNVPNLKIDFSQSPFYVNSYTKPWSVRIGKKRTCGVSAFGLSGTNCHVILQEYLQRKPCEETVQRPMDICCISAFSEESLRKLAELYRNYVNGSTSRVDEIVYNINVNHQHYKHRLAIVFSGKEDLLKKLNQYIDNRYRADISSIYTSNEKKLIVDEDYERICDECNLLLSQNNLNMQEYDELLVKVNKIAQWYAGGGEINWLNFYHNMESSRLSLPGYPFQSYHMWLAEPERAEMSTPANMVDSQVTEKTIDQSPLFYQKIQLREDLVQMPLADSDSSNKHILVICCGDNEFEQLTHQQEFCGYPIQIIELKTVVEGAEKYLLKQFVSIDFTAVSKIVFYFGTSSVNEFEVIKDVIKFYMLAIISLYRCIERTYSGDDVIQLFCLTKNGFYLPGQKEELRPEHSCILGVCKSLNRGIKHVHALCIETDGSTQTEKIKDEIFADTDKDIVFYRNNIRYIEGIKEITSLPKKKMIYRSGGVYLITGGLGGIGFETAKELSQRAENITIVLLGRTILPTREKWNEEIASGNTETVEKLKRLLLLEREAKKVVYYACDVTQYSQVLTVIDQIQKEYGRLNGIIHAAGVGGGTDFENLHEERILKMISAKIVGAYALDKATEHNNLDFFISFSSISTVFSSIDLPDYIAANVFLEEFAAWRSQKRKGLSLTIAWATWAETGMSVKNNFTMDTMFRSITTQSGIQALFQVMDSGLQNLIVGHLNFESKIILLIRKYPIQLSPFIEQKIQEMESKTQEITKNSVPKESSYIEIENQLCAVCCKVLGYSSIDVMDNFFELGADSIMLGHIFKEIDAIYPNLLNITDLFAYPTVALLAEFLSDKVSETEMEHRSQDTASLPVEETEADDHDVAIIGIGMKLPNASNLDEYWDILNNSINVVRDIPQTRSEDIVKHLKYKGMHSEDINFMCCGYLDKINTFDYAYFGMSPKESSLIEPAGRLFLQACAVAIEDAGYGGESIRGTKTGVFLGYTANIGNAYSRLLYEVDQELFGASMPVNQVSMMASRIAYAFDLKGPSMVIDTACSSSLVSLHTACEQIRNGGCDMALAGGASIMMTPLSNGVSIGFESPEYKTRAFADNSSGTAVGEGVCAVLLKSLKQAKIDGDSIYAVIKGSAINQDGRSQGIAAPNYLAQSEAIIRAWENAGVTADDISYIEAHGTGTQLGDPIEIKGINHAFMSKSTVIQGCGIGSLKTNIGHLNEASGMSGILKIILMLKYKTIPASLGFQVPNLNVDFSESPVYVVSKKTELKPKKDKVIIGINGFGMSGTNCHVIMQEAPSLSRKKAINQRDYIFTASAKTKTAFCKMIQEYSTFLSDNEMVDLSDFCYTANVGRTHFPYRLAVYVHTREELINKLKFLLYNLEQEIDDISRHTGYYSIVPESKNDRFPYEITSRMQKQMSLQAANILEQIKDTGDYSKIDELITLYVNGATVSWLDLYEKGKNRHIHIPVYPFEQSFCWYKVPQMEENPLDLNFHFEKQWIINKIAESDEKKGQGLTVVLLGKDNTYADLPIKLEQAGRKVCIVNYGDVYKKIDMDTYCIGHSVEDYIELFRALKNQQVTQVIHMKSIFAVQPFNAQEIDDRLDAGFFDVIALIKGMAKARFSSKFDLVLIANLAYSINKKEYGLLPENATLLSVGKVVEQENPNINCFAIDIDLVSDSDILCKQILCMNKTYLYGIRNNEFYQMESKRSELPVLKEEVIKAGQVYLVTGGTSGIGLEIANYISLQNPSTIILMSRSGFAPKENWEQLKKVKDYAHQISIFGNILNRGCTLRFEICDVSNIEALSRCIDKIHKEYGNIRGIFHSAGISGAGYILRKDKESFMQVLRPKIFGTLYLDQLTKDDDMDFMMLCSSAVTDSGEAGQSDYVAANAFVDAFTDYRNAQRRDTYTVNWVSWKETGMSVRHGINVDGVTKALTTKDAIQALDKLLRSSPRRAMIGQYNQEMDLSVFVQYSRCKMADELSGFIMKREVKDNPRFDRNAFSDGSRDIAKVTNGKMMFIPKSDKLVSASKQMGHVVLIGDSKGIYTETEHLVGDIYSRILGYKEINVYDNFFELGGDSIMLSSMYDLICNEFDEVITVADLFEYTNIRNLAKLIQQNLSYEKEMISKGEVIQYDTESEVIYPLSQAQKRIYYDSRLTKNKFAYNNPFLCDLTDMQGDIAEVVASSLHRHEILRTRFCIQNSKLMQRVVDMPKIEIKTVFVDSVYNIDYNVYLKQFNLMKDNLFNLTLFIDKQNNKMLLFDVHHIILDGFSSGLLQSEMMEYYMNHAIAEAPYQYRDFVSYEQQYVKTQGYQKMADYWLERLAGYNPDLRLKSFQGKERNPAYFVMTLDESFSNNMYEIASAVGHTVFSTFLFIINLLIYVEWNMDDIVLLTPTLNREKPQFKKMLGVFINLIPLRNQIKENVTVKEQMDKIFVNLRGDLQHQSYQYNDLIDCLKQHYIFHQFNMYVDFEDASLKSLNERDISFRLNHLKYDLDVVIKKRNNLYNVEIAYDNSIFATDSIEAMAKKMKTVIALLPEYIVAEKTVANLKQKIISVYMEKEYREK